MRDAVAGARPDLLEAVLTLVGDDPFARIDESTRFAHSVNELADALVSPVRWRETMTALDAAGARAYVDPGPGAVLAKLAPRCIPGARPLELHGIALQRAA